MPTRGSVPGLKQYLREFFFIGPAANDHHVAMRCAIGVAVPLLTVLWLGRIDLAIFASFGAFTGIYGRNESHAERFGHQLRAGALMLAVLLAGAVSSRFGLGPWEIVAGTTLVAGLGTLATGYWRLRPAGSLFHIFAYAAVSSVPGHPPIWQGMLTAALSVALSIAIGFSSRVLARHRTPWVRPAEAPFSAVERRNIHLDVLQYAAAAGAAGSIATLLGIGHNYWAMVAATVPLVGPTVRHKVFRGSQRILGTFGGLFLTAVILFPGLEPWLLVLLIAALQFGAEMLILRQYALAQVLVTPLALASTELAHHSDAAALLQDRLIETVIGAVVGMALVVGVHLASRRRIRVAA